MLQKLNLTYDQYLLAIRSELTKATLYYKRQPNAIEINNYNEHLLNLWGANMDLQYILDCYSAARYLFSYLLKSDSGLIRLLHEALNESKDANLNQRATLRKIANKFNNALILGAAQIADYILGTPMTKFSRACVFINTGPKDKAVKILKQKSKLEAMEEDETDIFEKGLLDHYVNRSGYKDLCLADFASKYSVTLKNKKTELKKRIGKPRVIRFVRYNKQKDRELFYREQLMLYEPWKDETKFDIIEGKSFEEMYKEMKKDKKRFDKFCEIRDSYNANSYFEEDIENFLQQMRNENEEEEQRAYRRLLDDEVESIDAFPDNNPDKNKNSGVGYAINIPPRVPKEEFLENMRMLNSLQRAFVNEVQMSCIQNNMNRMFIVQGTAGTGKSFLIKALYQMVTKFFDERVGNFEDKESCKVLLTGSTGVAAFLIGGTTYHSAFKFSKYSKEFSESVANTIRKELQHMEVLIIDEVSMMPIEHLHMIDKRMQSIFGNHLPFGGKMVILVGDFLQLRPVSAHPIYTKLAEKETRDTKEKFDNFNKDMLWGYFKLHELIEVVRQKDSFFKEVLLAIAYGCLTDEHIAYLREREFKNESEIPDSAIRLFYKNSDVDAFNKSKLEKMEGDLIIVESNDTAAEENLPRHLQEAIVQKFLSDINNDVRIPRQLHLKLNIKYMIPVNIDVLDGLVNGVIGTVKYITYDSNSEPFILWLDFKSDKIGKNRIAKFKKYQQNNSDISTNWVPITKECVEIQKSTPNEILSKNRIVRKQFPLTIAESMSIHKSQGQTFPEVCIDFRKGALKTDLLFVAASRTDYYGLYILGNFIKPKTAGNLNGINEINRLRAEARIQFSFDTLEDVSEGFVIIYQNINSFNPKAKYVIADKWYKRGDVVIFSEANVDVLHDNQIIEDFVPLFPLKEHNYHSKNNRGLVIMAKKDRNVKIHKMNIYEGDKENIHIDLKSFTIEDHYIITGYKSPHTSPSLFKQHLQEFLKDIPPNSKHITLIGDFNFESGKSEKFQKTILNKLVFDKDKNEIRFHNQLTIKDETTIRGTQIDVVFSTSTEGNGGVYPTYISDHHVVFYRSNKSEEKKQERKINANEKLVPKSDSKNRSKRKHNVSTERKISNKKICIEKNTDHKRNNDNLEGNIIGSLLDSEIISTVELPNCIYDIKMNRDGEIGNYNFYNLCCFNSCYHGFSNMYRNSDRFRAECDKIGYSSIFKVMSEKQSLKSEHEIYQLWVQFLLRHFKKEIVSSDQTPDGYPNYVINMENDALDIFGSFEDGTVTGNFKTCHKQIICSECLLVRDDQYLKNIILADIQLQSFNNITEFIIQSLEQSMNCLDNDCSAEANSLIRYNFMLILSIRKDNSDGSICFRNLKLQDLPQEIVLPYYFGGKKKIYRLEFIQNFILENSNANANLMDLAKELGHYTTILNYQESFLEIDDRKLEPTIRPLDFKVNPHTLIFLEVNDRELNKSKVFRNTLSFDLEISNNHTIAKRVINMCSFNSFIHGLIRLYRKDKSIQKYISENEENITLFSTIRDIVHSQSEIGRNNIWGQFLYSFNDFSENFEKGDMFDSDVRVLENLLKNYYSFSLKCTKCGKDILNPKGDKYGYSFLSIKITKQNKMQPNIFLRLIREFFDNCGKRQKCRDCFSSSTIETGKIIFVHIAAFQIHYSENNQGPELRFEQLPQEFELNGEAFTLAFIQNYIPGAFHFITKYKLTNDAHLNIDDNDIVTLVDNNELVNPKVLVFIKKC